MGLRCGGRRHGLAGRGLGLEGHRAAVEASLDLLEGQPRERGSSILQPDVGGRGAHDGRARPLVLDLGQRVEVCLETRLARLSFSHLGLGLLNAVFVLLNAALFIIKVF